MAWRLPGRISRITAALWKASGADIYFNSGNVGIGTASPTAPLSVKKASGINAALVQITDGSSFGTVIKFENLSAGGDSVTINIGATGNVPGAGMVLFGDNTNYRFGWNTSTGIPRFTSLGAGTVVADASGNLINASVAGPPQGRVTLTSGTAVTTSDVTGATSIYFTPVGGNQCPIYDGTNTVPTTFAELTLALDSNSGHTGYQQSAKIFDLFVINDSGTIRLGTGPAWSSDTARGTGAGTTELELKNGFWTNKNTITIRFGSSSGNTVSVAANRATYVGSFRATADGQASDTARQRILFNAYNQTRRNLLRKETANSWTYSLTAYAQANSNALNQVEILSGLTGPMVNLYVGDEVSSSSASAAVGSAIGLDSTTTRANDSFASVFQIPASVNYNTVARYSGAPGLGYHYLAWLNSGNGSGTQTWLGNGLGVDSGISGDVFL